LPSQPGSNSRLNQLIPRIALILIIIAVALAAGWLLLASRFDGQLFLAALAGLHRGWLVGALLLIAASYFGRAVRWQLMIRPLAAKTSLWAIFQATCVGFTAVVALGRAGEMVRPWMIARKTGLTFPSQMAVWFLERLLDLIVVLVFFGYALYYLRTHGGAANPGEQLGWVLEKGGGVAAGIGIAALVALFFLRAFSPARVASLEDYLHRSALGHMLAGFLHQVAEGFSCVRTFPLLVLSLLATLVEWGIIFACFHCILQAFGPTHGFSFHDALVLTGFVAFGGTLQLPGVGGGMQVAAVVAMTQIYGRSLEDATALALLLWVVSVLVVVPYGTLVAVLEGLSFSKIKNLSMQNEEQG
jgi:glycosyltransferase 2 family protein